MATFRSGAFSYRLPTQPGRYKVRLTFMEPNLAPGERVFGIRANGRPLLKDFDIAAQAGRPLSAVQHEVTVNVTGDCLVLEFRPRRGEAIVSAIEAARRED